MTETRPRPAELGAATEDPTIRPFQVSVPDEDLAELRRRLAWRAGRARSSWTGSSWRGIYGLLTNNGPAR